MENSPNHNFKSLDGQRFAYLTVLQRVENTTSGKSQWLCRCECGKEVRVRADHLKGSKIKSCGCKVAELVSTAQRKPQDARGIWNGMKERILCESTPSYAHYKKRGIRLCNGWRYNFESFLADMGERPPGLTLDRIDSKGHYSCGHCDDCKKNNWPANCKWSTMREQTHNRSSNLLVTYHGAEKCLAAWCDELHMDYGAVYGRIKMGWSIEDALETPIRGRVEQAEEQWENEMRELVQREPRKR